MARYDYICTSCNRIFEVEHPMDARPDAVCPICGSSAQRHFASSSIVFKGSGFYNTDQRDKGSSSEASAPDPHSCSCENCPRKSE